MNQSTEGPQAGWIYVDAIEELPGGQFYGHLVSFDAGGNYRGTIDESKVTPFAPGNPISKVNSNAIPSVINVSPGGTIYIFQEGFPVSEIEKFQPVDETAEHDVYIGQLRGASYRFQADDNYVFAGKGGNEAQVWEKYDGNAFTVPAGQPSPILTEPSSKRAVSTPRATTSPTSRWASTRRRTMS